MCLLCLCCGHRKQTRPKGHLRKATTMNDILLSVGFQYAFCRQFIFLTNALLIGCSMALIAAGIQQQESNVGIWLGSAWYQTVMALGGSALLTTLLGCIGSCYQNTPALILVCILSLFHILAQIQRDNNTMQYIIVLVLLIMTEALIIFLASSSEMDQVLEDNWNKLEEKAKQDIANEFQCDMNVAADCIAAARGQANAAQRLILFVCGGTIVYQLIMIAFTIFYLRGLRRKKQRIKDIKHEKDKAIIELSPASDGLEELDSRDYKDIKHV